MHTTSNPVAHVGRNVTPSAGQHSIRRAARAAARWSVALVFAACGGSSDPATGVAGSPDSPRSPGGSPHTRVPETLVGKWYQGQVSSTNYYDPSNGHWSGPSGTGNAWTFTAEGRFTRYTLLQQSFYGCTTSIFWWEEGTVSADDEQARLTTTRAQIKSVDNCSAKYNYDRLYTVGPRTVPYEVAADAASGRLTLTLRLSDEVQTFRGDE